MGVSPGVPVAARSSGRGVVLREAATTPVLVEGAATTVGAVSSGSGAVKTTRAFCAAVSSASGEPLAATASRVDHWILIEYRSAWAREVLGASLLSSELKQHLRSQLAALPHARLLFVKKPRGRLDTGSRVFFGTSRPGAERLFELELEHLDDVLHVDAAAVLAGTSRAIAGTEAVTGPTAGTEAVAEPLYIVCTHGKRDRCCALYGRPLYDALQHETDSGRVWQSSHVGGDRFAGNAVVLPHGLYYGRVGPADAARVVAATTAGQIDLDAYRGRSAYSFAVQAGERALRECEGLLGIDDLELAGTARDADGRWRVLFRTPDGAVHELQVAESLADEPMYLTCESTEPRHARRWRVSGHDVVSP
jgi:hypothetical protein